MPLGWTKKLLFISGAALFLWLGGFVIFVFREPLHHVGKSDAAVVFTGSAGRIEKAVELLENGEIGRLLISGVNAGVRTQDLENVVGISPELLACCIDVGHGAQNTLGNAKEAAAWVTANNYRKLMIVTASYHMPRAYLVASKAMPDIHMIPYSVDAPASIYGLAKEYSKYLLVLIGVRVGVY